MSILELSINPKNLFFLIYELICHFRSLEALALMVSCLCHDLDHRGTTNSFQMQSGTELASLYSSEGSVMEVLKYFCASVSQVLVTFHTEKVFFSFLFTFRGII